MPWCASGFSPMKMATTGLVHFSSKSTTSSRTSGAGGFEMTQMTSVGSWFSSATMASFTVTAPTFSLRSRPPVPMACTQPPPKRSIMHVTSWMPVPEAPTMPMLPGLMTFVKAMGTLEMTPVPQSGPMKRRPFSCAFCFRRTSSSSGTLSVKEKTLRPRSRARSSSGAAYSPGMEKSAMLASGSCAMASSQLVASAGPPAASFFTERSARKASVSASTVSRMAASSLSTTMTMSDGFAAAASSVRRPAAL